VGCAVLAQLAGFAYPKLTQLVIDDVIGKGQAELLLPVVLGLFAAFAFRDGFNSLRIRLNNTFEQHVVLDIRNEVFRKLQRLPTTWFDRRTSGDVVTRVIEDVNSMERLLIDGTEQGVVAILGLLGVGTILFWTHPMLAVVAIVPIPFLFGGALWYTLTAHKRYRKRSRASAAMNALLMDNLQGIRQVKSYGRETHEEARFGKRANDLREGTLAVMRAWAWYQPGMALIAAMGTVGVLWLGGKEVLAGEMTQGELVSFLLFLAMFYQPIAQLHGLNQMTQSARASGERVFDILDAEEEPFVIAHATGLMENEMGLADAIQTKGKSTAMADSEPVTRVETVREPEFQQNNGETGVISRGEVIFDGVSAAYDGREVLHAIHLRVPPGETLAIVGPTGAGKSTLVNLVPRFYEITGGKIVVDGQDISQLPLAELRGKIAIVSQEPFLFNDTIGENIRYGRLDASEKAIEQAAAAAHCMEFIERLPEGFATRVGERGVRLSVGEKQRVSIARALLRNAPILILDEATASVDTATERLIQSALERLMDGRTSLVIAHRLGTIIRAQQIIVLQNGRVVERGRHEMLLGADGLYARLWQAQTLSEQLGEYPERPDGVRLTSY
jgi:ABC-type multidrug transport system fused ATPase/permease subunit